jgi:hypothetical protein
MQTRPRPEADGRAGREPDAGACRRPKSRGGSLVKGVPAQDRLHGRAAEGERRRIHEYRYRQGLTDQDEKVAWRLLERPFVSIATPARPG